MKRIISALLALLMVATMIPVAFATEEEPVADMAVTAAPATDATETADAADAEETDVAEKLKELANLPC